jgi:hypothetical protein
MLALHRALSERFPSGIRATVDIFTDPEFDHPRGLNNN